MAGITDYDNYLPSRLAEGYTEADADPTTGNSSSSRSVLPPWGRRQRAAAVPRACEAHFDLGSDFSWLTLN